MCTPIAAGIIEDVVTEFIGQNRQFTAVDITNEVKGRLAQGHHPFERHTELKGHVHVACDQRMDATWDRSLIQLPGIKDAAYLYHPVGTDPQDYVKGFTGKRRSLPAGLTAAGTGFATPSPAQGVNTPAGLAHSFGPVAIPSARPSPVRSSDPGRRRPRGGRLIIARKFLSAIGLKPGDDGYITAQGSTMVISGSPGSTGSLVILHVDGQGRIRLGRKARLTLGVEAPEFSIAPAGKTVVVEPA